MILEIDAPDCIVGRGCFGDVLSIDWTSRSIRYHQTYDGAVVVTSLIAQNFRGDKEVDCGSRHPSQTAWGFLLVAISIIPRFEVQVESRVCARDNRRAVMTWRRVLGRSMGDLFEAAMMILEARGRI